MEYGLIAARISLADIEVWGTKIKTTFSSISPQLN